MVRIAYGQHVISSDGHDVGTVSGLVADAGNKRITRLAFDQGLFRDERMVAISAVTAVDGDRLTLDVSKETASLLPIYDQKERVFKPRVIEPPIILPPGGVGGPVMYESATTGTGWPGGNIMDTAPFDPPPVEVVSNLEDFEVRLEKGTDVVASDGQKVGTLDEIDLGDRGEIDGIVARAGFLFAHDVRIPGSEIAELDDKRVLLGVNRNTAEQHRV